MMMAQVTRNREARVAQEDVAQDQARQSSRQMTKLHFTSQICADNTFLQWSVIKLQSNTTCL